MKRVTSVFIILAMILSFASMNTMAAEAGGKIFSDVAETDYYAEAAGKLQQTGVLAGYPDGTFGAAKSITRAEMAAVVCRVLGKETEAQSLKGATAYNDVPAWHWASGYINYATNNGIIAGDGNGKFRPGDDVKYEEAIKMVVVALGLANGAVSDPSDWSKVYIDIANANGMTGKLLGEKGKAATRGDIAVMTHSGIEAKKTASADDSEAESKNPNFNANDKNVAGLPGKGGNSSSSTPSLITVTAAELEVSGAAVDTAKVGDVLTLTTTPANATGTVVWTVGGVEIDAEGISYTVSAFDMGKTVKAEFTANGSYQGTVSAQVTVENTVEVSAGDIMSEDADSSPVVLTDAGNTKFLDDEGSEVVIGEDATLTLSITNPEMDEEEVSAAQTIVVSGIIENTDGATEEDISDITTMAVDVNLSVNETAVHPVGDVTVTLSAEQLGLPAGTDLSKYTFAASHTNKEGVEELVEGELVEIEKIQYIRFELNGLSTIWIGNIPPRTVSFYNTEEDADNKENSIGSVIVKFGDLTPTKEIPTAARDGYIFCGWNYDMTRTPIITNLEVHALWVEGVKMPSANISAELSEETDALAPAVSDGLVSVAYEEEGALPAELELAVSITAPEGAVKYYSGTDASVVATFDDENGFKSVDALENITVDVTDADGLIIPFAYTYYYKWIDESGEDISVQELKVQIANGSDTAKSMEYTANVNRGVGKFEAYLIDSDDASKDYVAYINNHLSGKATTGYTLYSNISFDGYRNDYDFSAYDTLKFVFTPFDGESYSNGDEITASGEYYSDDTWNENWNGTCKISGGKLIVTYPFNVSKMTDDYANAYISVNGTEQNININWHDGGYNEDPERIRCETWAEAVSAIKSASSSKEYYITCSDSSAITLSSSLKIPANVDVVLSDSPSFTVAKGATLTLEDDRDHSCASALRMNKGDFVAADGATIITAYAGTDDGTRYYPSINAKNITFKSGAKLTIPEDTLLSMHAVSYNDEAEKGVLSFDAGSVVANNGNLYTNNFDVINVNGTLNATYYTYFYGDEINVNGKVAMNTDSWARLEMYGTVTVGQNGSVTVNNTGNRVRTNLEIYGPLTNKGTIELKGGAANAEIMNNGFVNYNEGTISVASGCSIATSGTKYINTGVITGAGKMTASLGDDYTNYDDGTEYVIVEEDEYYDQELGEWVYGMSDYSRYKYTHDPAKTVDVILYLAEVINMGNGKCTLTVDAESFPEKQ